MKFHNKNNAKLKQVEKQDYVFYKKSGFADNLIIINIERLTLNQIELAHVLFIVLFYQCAFLFAIQDVF
jgi:hypothetical protein